MRRKRYKPRIPRNAAPVARSVALRCLATRIRLKLTVEEAAKRLGIKPGHYVYIEQGRIIPGPRLSERLRLWATVDDISFADQPFKGEAHYTGDGKPWPTKKIRFPPEEYIVIKRAAYKVGMTPEQYIYFATRLLTQNGRALLNVTNAMREVQWTQSVQALQDENLRYFLEAEESMLAEPSDAAPAPGATYKPVIERFIEEVPLEGEEEVEEL